jgi:hypothetical protein
MGILSTIASSSSKQIKVAFKLINKTVFNDEEVVVFNGLDFYLEQCVGANINLWEDRFK